MTPLASKCQFISDWIKNSILPWDNRSAPAAGQVSGFPAQYKHCSLPKHPVLSPKMSIIEARHLQTVISLYLQPTKKHQGYSSWNWRHHVIWITVSVLHVMQTDYSTTVYNWNPIVCAASHSSAQYHDRGCATDGIKSKVLTWMKGRISSGVSLPFFKPALQLHTRGFRAATDPQAHTHTPRHALTPVTGLLRVVLEWVNISAVKPQRTKRRRIRYNLDIKPRTSETLKASVTQ